MDTPHMFGKRGYNANTIVHIGGIGWRCQDNLSRLFTDLRETMSSASYFRVGHSPDSKGR
jgi:hypothetical protein